MNAILKLGKYLFALPFAVFGISHIFKTAKMNELIGGAPGGLTGVIISGVFLVLGVISILIGKWDKLAAILLAAMLLFFAFAIHLPKALDTGDIGDLFKDIGLAGGAMMYASHLAKDKSIIG